MEGNETNEEYKVVSRNIKIVSEMLKLRVSWSLDETPKIAKKEVFGISR